jgi:hypothetical protein
MADGELEGFTKSMLPGESAARAGLEKVRKLIGAARMVAISSLLTHPATLLRLALIITLKSLIF